MFTAGERSAVRSRYLIGDALAGCGGKRVRLRVRIRLVRSTLFHSQLDICRIRSVLHDVLEIVFVLQVNVGVNAGVEISKLWRLKRQMRLELCLSFGDKLC